MKNITKELANELLNDITNLIDWQVDMDTYAEIDAIVKMLKEYFN